MVIKTASKKIKLTISILVLLFITTALVGITFETEEVEAAGTYCWIITPKGGGWYTANPLTLDWGTQFGQGSYQIRIIGTNNYDTGRVYTSATSRSWSNLPDGNYQWMVKAYYPNGIWMGDSNWQSFRYDRTAPGIPSPNDGVSGWTSYNSRTFTWSTPSDGQGSGVAYYEYSVDNAAPFSTTTSNSVTVSSIADGSHTFRVLAKDRVGHFSAWGQHQFYIDTTRPSTPGPYDSYYSWTTDNTPTFYFGSSDGLSGITGYYYAMDDSTPESGGTWLATSSTSTLVTLNPVSSGTYTFYVKARNGAGLLSYAGSHIVYIDTTRPTDPTSAVEIHGVVSGQWTNINTPSFRAIGATDGHSGLYYYYYYLAYFDSGWTRMYHTRWYNPGTITISRTYYLYADSEDYVGNMGTGSSVMFIYKYDGIDPTNPTAAVEAGSVNDIWQNTTDAPSFLWSGAYDGHSGVDGYYYYFGPNSSGVDDNYTVDLGCDPPAVDNGTYYLRVRTRDEVTNEADDWADLYTFRYDSLIPINPNATVQTNGTTVSGIWQNDVNDPAFNWTGANDTHSGVDGYYYYWGTNESGISDNFTTNESYDPTEVTVDGTYYLRVKTRDIAGNNATWVTLYTFQYDNSSPVNPDSCTQLIGPTETDVWQNFTSDPSFEWSGAYDDTAGVYGYFCYFGTDPEGTADHHTMEEAYDPSEMEDGTYYMRVMTNDTAGNNATWVTLYTLLFDATAPLNPTDAAQVVGETESSVWQNAVDDPELIWSGALDETSGIWGYHVYWGPDPNGTSDEFTTEAGHDPDEVEDGTYYLRVTAVDNARTFAGWITLYMFRYDITAPIQLEPDDGFDGYWPLNTTTFTWEIPEDLSNVSGFFYMVDDGDEIWTEENSVKLEPQSDGAHMFHVKAMDIAGNIGGFGSHEFFIDTEAPYGHIVINDDEIYTTSTTVKLSVFGIDDTGGVSEMRFSDDAEYWSVWEPVDETFEWDLPSGGGEKAVYVQFRDVAGLISTGTLFDTIILDVKLPKGTFTINGGDQYTTDPEVMLSMMGEDENGIVSMKFSADGETWSEWEPYNETREYTLSEGDGLKTVYVVFMDGAGLESYSAISAGITLDTTPPTGSIIINGDEEYTLILSVELALMYEDENDVVQMRFSDDWKIWTDWEPVGNTISYTIPDGEGMKSVYVQFRDVPGLVSTVEITDGIMLYTTDTDDDGMVDFLDEDDDNDGYTDVEEMEAGTDPMDLSDHPVEEESRSFLLFGVIVAVLLLLIIGAIIGAFLLLRPRRKQEEEKPDTAAPVSPPVAGAALAGATSAPGLPVSQATPQLAPAQESALDTQLLGSSPAPPQLAPASEPPPAPTEASEPSGSAAPSAAAPQAPAPELPVPQAPLPQLAQPLPDPVPAPQPAAYQPPPETQPRSATYQRPPAPQQPTTTPAAQAPQDLPMMAAPPPGTPPSPSQAPPVVSSGDPQ